MQRAPWSALAVIAGCGGSSGSAIDAPDAPALPTWWQPKVGPQCPPLPPQDSAVVCPQQSLAMIADGIYKDVELTKNVRTQYSP